MLSVGARRSSGFSAPWAALFLGLAALVGALSLVIPVAWLLAGMLGLAAFVYLFLNPDKLFYLTILTIPFTDRVRVLPISFSLNELILLTCVLACVTQWFFQERKIDFRTALDPWVALLCLMFFLAGYFSESDTGLLGFFKIFEAFIMYYMTVYFVQSKQVTRAQALRVVLWTALSQATLGIFQSVTGIGSDFQSSRGYLGYLGLGSNTVWHGRGTTWHFNTLGNYLATNLVLFVPLCFYAKKARKISLVLLGILLLGIITTYSRGSLLGLSAGVIFYLAVSQKSWKKSLIWTASFAGFIIAPLALSLANTEYVNTVSYEDRLIIWQVPLAAITSSVKATWLGSGINSYGVVAWPFIPAWVPPDQYRNWFAHNFYLLTVIEVGIVGACILFGFLAYICLAALRKFKREKGFISLYGLSISAAMITVFFVSIFDHTFGSPHFKVFIFLLLGLLYVKRQPPVPVRG